MGRSTVGDGGRDVVEHLLDVLRDPEAASTSLAELEPRVSAARAELRAHEDRTGQSELAEALATWATEHEDAEQSRDAMLRAAELAQEADDGELACDLYERALQRDPTHPTAIQELTRLLTASEDYARLESARMEQVDLLESHAPLERELRIQALTALAALRAQHLHDLDSAIGAYQEALEIEPLDETREALAALHMKRGQASDRDDAAELYFRMGEHLPAEEARPLLERALDCNPEHEGALTALQELAQAAPDEVDEEGLRSRMIAFASVAPASAQRDSVIEQLKAQGSEVPDFDAPPPPRVPTAEPASSSWDRVPPDRSSEGAAAGPRPAASEGARPTTPPPGPASGWPPPDSLSPVTGPDSAAVQRGSRSRLGWVGAAGLAALIAVAAIGIGGSDEEPEPTAATRPSSTAGQAADERLSPRATPEISPVPKTPEGPEIAPRGEAPSQVDDEPPKSARRGKRMDRQVVRGERAARAAKGGAVLVEPLLRLPPAMDEREAVLAALARVQRRVDRCYARARRRSPELSGLIEYAWTVRRGGRVLRVRALSDSLHASGVRTCGITAIRNTRFPRHRAKRPVELRAVFDFVPPK